MLDFVNIRRDFCCIKQVHGSIFCDIKGSYCMTSNLLKKKKKKVIQKTFVEVSPRAPLHQNASTTESSSVITRE